MLAALVARRRSVPGSGSLTRKEGRYPVAGAGEVRSYTYWQASREFPTVGTNVARRRQRVRGIGASPAEARRRCNANYDAREEDRSAFTVVRGFGTELRQPVNINEPYRIGTQIAYSSLSPVMTVQPPGSKPSGSPPSARGFHPRRV
jgi:hypothetical protein